MFSLIVWLFIVSIWFFSCKACQNVHLRILSFFDTLNICCVAFDYTRETLMKRSCSCLCFTKMNFFVAARAFPEVSVAVGVAMNLLLLLLLVILLVVVCCRRIPYLGGLNIKGAIFAAIWRQHHLAFALRINILNIVCIRYLHKLFLHF